MDGPELCALYIARHAARCAGRHFRQGPLAPAFKLTHSTPGLALFAHMRMRGVPLAVHRALMAWRRGERRVDLCFCTPTPLDLLALQARGRRCVSLLPDGADTGHHANPLAFAIHDLCHLEKFFDREFYVEQVGFFSLLHHAIEAPAWVHIDAGLDETWLIERDYVLADMNGSAVFLLLSLKSRIRAAVRRAIAFSRDGAMTPDEVSTADAQVAARQRVLYASMGLTGHLADAADALTSRGASELAGAELRAYFQAIGQAVLGGAAAHTP